MDVAEIMNSDMSQKFEERINKDQHADYRQKVMDDSRDQPSPNLGANSARPVVSTSPERQEITLSSKSRILRREGI